MRVLSVTPPPALSLSALFLQSYPSTFSSHIRSIFSGFLFQMTHPFRLGQKNTICTALGDDDPSSEPIHRVFIAFSNSIMEKKKNPESYISPPHLFHLLVLEHQPDQRAPPPPLPLLSTLPGSSSTHHTHTTHTHNASIQKADCTAEPECLIYFLLFAFTAKKREKKSILVQSLLLIQTS